MKFIPYGHQSIDEQDIKEVVKVLRSDWITTGPKIAEFEKELCRYIGCSHAVAVNSGTSALDIAVQALNLPNGSEVITTPFTFVATTTFSRLTPKCLRRFPVIRSLSPMEYTSAVSKKLMPASSARLMNGFACSSSSIHSRQSFEP